MPNNQRFERKPRYCAALDERTPTHGERLIYHLSKSHALTTIQQYRALFSAFRHWCEDQRRICLPATEDTILEFLTSRYDNGATYTHLRNTVSAINCYHVSNGINQQNTAKITSLLSTFFRGYTRNPMRPVTVKNIRDMCDVARFLRAPLRAARDVAILIHTYASAQRSAEVRERRVEDLLFIPPNRLIIVIPKSKGDPDGQGQRVGIRASKYKEYCPIETLRHWLNVSGIQEGPVFRRIDRHGNLGEEELDSSNLWRIVRDYATLIGLGKRIGPQSLRRGFATDADEALVSSIDIQAHLRHKSVETTRLYIDRPEIRWDRNITGLLFDP